MPLDITFTLSDQDLAWRQPLALEGVSDPLNGRARERRHDLEALQRLDPGHHVGVVVGLAVVPVGHVDQLELGRPSFGLRDALMRRQHRVRLDQW